MAHRKVRSVAGKGRIGACLRSLVVWVDSHGADHCLAEGIVRILEGRENPIGERVDDLGHVVKTVAKAEAVNVESVVAGVDRAKQGMNWVNKAYHTINLRLDEVQVEVSVSHWGARDDETAPHHAGPTSGRANVTSFLHTWRNITRRSGRGVVLSLSLLEIKAELRLGVALENSENLPDDAGWATQRQIVASGSCASTGWREGRVRCIEQALRRLVEPRGGLKGPLLAALHTSYSARIRQPPDK